MYSVDAKHGNKPGLAGLPGGGSRSSLGSPTSGRQQASGSLRDPFGSSGAVVPAGGSLFVGSKALKAAGGASPAAGTDRFRRLQLQLALIQKQGERNQDSLVAFRDAFKAWVGGLPAEAFQRSEQVEQFDPTARHPNSWAPLLGELLDFCLKCASNCACQDHLIANSNQQPLANHLARALACPPSP